jgi:hypothetical protein
MALTVRGGLDYVDLDFDVKNIGQTASLQSVGRLRSWVMGLKPSAVMTMVRAPSLSRKLGARI